MRYFFIGMLGAFLASQVLKIPVERACHEGARFWCGVAVAMGAKEEVRK